MKNIDAHKAK